MRRDNAMQTSKVKCTMTTPLNNGVYNSRHCLENVFWCNMSFFNFHGAVNNSFAFLTLPRFPRSIVAIAWVLIVRSIDVVDVLVVRLRSSSRGNGQAENMDANLVQPHP